MYLKLIHHLEHKVLKKATDIDVIKDVIDFVLNKDNWTRSKRTVGYREVVTIEGIGALLQNLYWKWRIMFDLKMKL